VKEPLTGVGIIAFHGEKRISIGVGIVLNCTHRNSDDKKMNEDMSEVQKACDALGIEPWIAAFGDAAGSAEPLFLSQEEYIRTAVQDNLSSDWFKEIMGSPDPAGGGEEATRRWLLGQIGETLAAAHLRRAGFSEIRNLNTEFPNHPFADICAKREGKTKKETYAISVKARNRYENNGGLNGRYKLGRNSYKHAETLKNETGWVPLWLAVSIDVNCYSIYVGTLEFLEGNLGIPMGKKAIERYECLAKNIPDDGYECLAKNIPNSFDQRAISNAPAAK
jgi:hypothetical protein